jgi:predicted dehydrogenase
MERKRTVTKRYRLGVIGFAHMHVVHVAAEFGRHPQVDWVACADSRAPQPEVRTAPFTREWNRQQVVDTWKIPKTYEDYEELLANEEIDIAIVCSENAQHAEITEACAAAGVHVVVEKPMAVTLADGLRMVRACEAAGTSLMVNWPLTWSAAARKAKELIDEGVVGRVLEVKWRSGHTGPLGPQAKHPGVTETSELMTGPERAVTWWHQTAPCGGAMVDYCCYGALVSRWYVGEPATAALAMRANLDSHWGDADDNAVIIVRFPQALALLEGSWTVLDHGVPTGPIVYGTTGTLVVEQRGEKAGVRLERGRGQSDFFTPDPLPEGRDTLANEFIHHLETGEPLHTSLDMHFNLEVQAILDAGVRAADSQRMELVNNATWQIG